MRRFARQARHANVRQTVHTRLPTCWAGSSPSSASPAWLCLDSHWRKLAMAARTTLELGRRQLYCRRVVRRSARQQTKKEVRFHRLDV